MCYLRLTYFLCGSRCAWSVCVRTVGQHRSVWVCVYVCVGIGDQCRGLCECMVTLCMERACCLRECECCSEASVTLQTSPVVSEKPRHLLVFIIRDLSVTSKLVILRFVFLPCASSGSTSCLTPYWLILFPVVLQHIMRVWSLSVSKSGSRNLYQFRRETPRFCVFFIGSYCGFSDGTSVWNHLGCVYLVWVVLISRIFTF